MVLSKARRTAGWRTTSSRSRRLVDGQTAAMSRGSPFSSPSGRYQCQCADGREIHSPAEAITDKRAEGHAQATATLVPPVTIDKAEPRRDGWTSGSRGHSRSGHRDRRR